MKKLLLFVIACTLGLFGAVNAQETITIGNGADEAYNLCDGYAGYGASQQIYTAEEIANAGGSAGTITSLAFKKERGTDYDRTWSIYLKNIDETVFTNLGSSYNAYSYIYTMSSDDLVYEGTFTTSNDWVTFDIEPFEYDGRNLLVTVVQNSGVGGADQFWRYTTNTDYSTNQCLVKYATAELDVTQKLNWNMFAGRFDIQLTIAAEEGGGEEPEPTPEPEQPGNDLIVTVGSGTEVEAFVPAQTNYDNTISQQIYLAEDFQGKTGKIKSYAFKCAKNLESYSTPITVTRNFKVYMINTDKSSFTSASDWAAVTESDLVFDGSVTFQPKDEWTVVTFDTPFEYEEGKNVLICINDASDYVNGTMNYYSHVTENVRSLVFYADGNPYDATAIAVSSKFDNLNYVAQAQFEFVSEGGGEEPTPEPETPVVDLTKQYRVKATSLDKYLYVMDNYAHASGTNGGVIVYQTVDDNAQLFTLEDAGDGAYYFKSATGYYIYCQAWNVDAYSTTEKTALKMVDQGDGTFRLQNTNNNKYFKVQQVGMFYYPFCDCDGDGCTIETWTLEAVETPDPTPEPEPTAPAAPVVTVTPNGHNSLIFSWEPVEGATQYNVYSGEYVIAEITETTYTVGYLQAETNYCFSISAVNEGVGESDLTEACGTTEAAPTAPAIPVVTYTTTETAITLTWDAVENADSYNIYTPDNYAGSNVLYLEATTYTFEGLTAGIEYCFLVSSVSALGYESDAVEVCVTITAAPVEPEPDQPGSEELASEFSFDFEDGTLTGLRAFAGEGSDAPLLWTISNSDYYNDGNGTNVIYSESCDYDWNAYPSINNYIVTENAYAITAESKLSWYVRHTDYNAAEFDIYEVVVSTDGTNFSQIWSGAASSSAFSQEVSLAEYAGQNLYIGFRHYCTDSYGGGALVLDNIVLTAGEGGGEGGGEEPTDPETPSTDNNRLVSVTQDSNWDNLTYVYESQTSNKVLRVLKGVDQGYGVYVTVLEYDENGVITGSEYKWLENGALTNSNYIDEYEYTYTEGVLTSYTQTSGYDYFGTPTPVEYVLTYDANGNVETVVYGTNKVVYTYEDGKLVKEVMSYVMNGVEETEYEIDYAYENGNCISATQYSVLDGERIARKAAEYFYDLTVEAEDVFSFVYPHEVKPASVNVLTKVLSYEYQEDYFSGAITKSNIKILTYNYNFEVESVSFPPMGLSARAISDTQIELSWVATEETEKFAVYQNDTYIGESESTYFTVEGLTANTEYCFTVKGVNGEVESEASEAACAKTMNVVSVDPTTIAFGELRLGEYWSEREVTVGVSINRLGKTITSITCDDAFFTLPTDIDLTSEYIWFEMGYDKTATAAGEYTATLTVTLESGVTVEIPVTATAYAPATPDVFELAQEVTFTEGVYTDTPNFATLHDDYAMPNENEWDETDAPDAVYSFTLEEESVVSVSVTGDNAAYAIFQAEGFEAPYEGNVFTGEVKNLNTEFVYNFDNNSLADFTIVDNDEYKDFTWAIEEGEKGYQLVSYSYYGWFAEDNSWTWIDKADERLITNNAYPISAKSVLSFDMNVNGSFEEIIIEVTKDGESFTEIERITETSYSYDWLAKSVNVGEKFAELGLEYGDYQIVLYHKVDGYGELNIDNLVLAERVRTYPVGEYYLFAAAESAFTVEVNTTPAEDITFEPEIPVAKAYRLESIESFNVESYVYDEIYTNRVLSYVGSDGLDNILTYNKAGQLETVKSVFIMEGEEPQVISSIEYAYNEDGTLASYSESSPHPMTGAMFTTTTEYTYENGRLVKVENADYEVETTLVYNEDGTVKEIVESYMTTIMTYENGKLVKKAYGYEDEESGEFVTEAEDIYTYDVNGNCVKQESYEYGKLYQVYEFYYDVKVAAEDVYSFELPHLAMTNVEPSSNNILVKKLSYYSYFDEEVGEVLTHSYDVTIYHYNPAVEMAPITPINLVAEVVDGVVELTWEKFIDAETFTVYQDGEIIAQNVEEGAYTVEDLEAGEYCFAVRAYNKTGASATTEEVCIEIKESGDDPVVPEAPVVTPEATSDSTIVLTWAAVDGATNYNVYSADTLVANVTETTYTVTGLEAEKEYCFNVTAVNEVGGESAKSENACATTLKEGNAPTVLEAPVVQVVEITETTIVIAWNPVESATNYKVFANDQLITTLPDTIAGFRELTPNTEYCFTVVAINEVGESAPSEKVCATTKPDAIAENVAAFNIYPNPVADKLFIETEATVEEVTIYTLTGVMIYSEVDYNNNTINVSDLSGGVYFIKVRTDNGEVVKRFIKK